MDLLSPSLGVFFWQFVAVISVIFILKKFFFKIVFNILEKRETMITTSIENAKRINEELKKIELIKKNSLEEIESKKTQTLKEVEDLKNKLIAEAKENAKNIENKLIDEAKKEIERQKQQFKDQYNAEIAKLAIIVSEKLLQKELSEDNKQNIFLNTIISETIKTSSRY